MIRVISFSIAVATVSAVMYGQPRTASVDGKLLFPGDTVRAGIPIRVHRVNKGSGNDFTEADRVFSGADGSFQTKAMPHGRYAVCIDAEPQMGILNPCEWRSDSKELDLSDTSGRGQTIRAVAGTRVRFRLEDPEKLLRRPLELSEQRPLPLVGVFDGSGFFHIARVVSVGQTHQEWMIVVPKNATYTVHGSAPGVRVGESSATKGTSMSKGLDLRAKTTEQEDFVWHFGK